jgi:hypothetical protein
MSRRAWLNYPAFVNFIGNGEVVAGFGRPACSTAENGLGSPDDGQSRGSQLNEKRIDACGSDVNRADRHVGAVLFRWYVRSRARSQ